MSKTVELARHLSTLNINNMYKTDFYWTWDKTDDEIDAIFTVADALRDLRERNKSTRVFDSGLGISIFRDNSTRTRFSFASACNLLGLEVQDLDEKKSQIAHGETVRETANMVSFMADVIGIRDDMFIGEGHKYQKTFMDAEVGVDAVYAEVLPEDKAAFIRQEKAKGHTVIMVGDGVNDSPALSEADAGIAISTGAAIAREIADITVASEDLFALVTLRRLGEALMERIHGSYRFIVGFNLTLIALGVAGVLPPTTSALLHNGSTLGISLRNMTDLLKKDNNA